MYVKQHFHIEHTEVWHSQRVKWCKMTKFTLPFIYGINYWMLFSFSTLLVYIYKNLFTHTIKSYFYYEPKKNPNKQAPRKLISHPLSLHGLWALEAGVVDQFRLAPHSSLFSKFWFIVTFYNGLCLLLKGMCLMRVNCTHICVCIL